MFPVNTCSFIACPAMNLEMLYKALNNHFTDSLTICQSPETVLLMAEPWTAWEPSAPGEQAIPKSKGQTGSCLTTNHCDQTFCKSRHKQEEHREGPKDKGSVLHLRCLLCFPWGPSLLFQCLCTGRVLERAVMAQLYSWSHCSQQKWLNGRSDTRNDIWSISTVCFHSFIQNKGVKDLHKKNWNHELQLAGVARACQVRL